MFKKRTPKIDFKRLGINKKSRDSDEEQMLMEEISIYMNVKFTNEHPTPWNLDYSFYRYMDSEGFDNAIYEGYLEKIMPEDFPEHFEKYSTAELIRQSQCYIEPDISKEDVIKILMEEADYSWIVTKRGLDYLESHPIYDFLQHILQNSISMNSSYSTILLKTK